MEYFDHIWEAVPAGMLPLQFELRRDYLLARVAAGERVLDIGCGEAHFTSALVAAGARAIGADVAALPLHRAHERESTLELVLLNGSELPFTDAQFDVVWAGELLEHVQDVVGLVVQLHRVLRPGGQLLISTPDHPLRRRLWLALAPGAFARHFEPRSDHVRFFVAASLRTLLTDAGFAAPRLRRRGGQLLASSVRY